MIIQKTAAKELIDPKYVGYQQLLVKVGEELVRPEDAYDDEAYPFARWNHPARIGLRSCFTFACNAFEPDITEFPVGTYYLHVPVPGATSGQPFGAFTSIDLETALVSDGCVRVPYSNMYDIDIPDTHRLIACYHAERDYHFFRYYKQDGFWYSKGGWAGHRVTNLDFSGRNIVHDPQRCNRLDYNGFAGFFYVPQKSNFLNIILEDQNGVALYGKQPMIQKHEARNYRQAVIASCG